MTINMTKTGFPFEIASLNQWVCWRLEPDSKGGKDRKVPYNPATGYKASSTDPRTWTDCETALMAKDQYMYTGVGFVFVKDGGIVGVDIDHCLDPESGEPNDTAKEILKMLPPTYIEVSPSGTGLHIFLRGSTPKGGSKNSKTGVEMYAHSRYFTMTGKRYGDSTDTIAEDGGALKQIHDAFIRPPKKQGTGKRKKQSSAPLTDEELLEKARMSATGDNFTQLWDGQWQDLYESQSEADMALCCKLAFWSGRNIEQMDRLFRQSKLFRAKWDERHRADGATYGEETLKKATELTEDVYTPDSGAQVFAFDGRYFRAKGEKIYPLTNFLIEPVEMLISEDETQLTADLVTVNGETFRTNFKTSDFGHPQKFKGVLNKNTIALAYLGTEGDLELFKSYISELPWKKKIGVSAIGIYAHEGNMVYVSGAGAVMAGGKAVDSIVQLKTPQSIQSGILSCKMLKADNLRRLGTLLMRYNEPIKTVSILAWTAGCFVKPHLRISGIKYPHLFLIGEAGSGKSNTLERVILPVFSRTKILAATQVTPFTLMKESASSNLFPQSLDEFKPSKMDKFKQSILYNHFRDAYDGHEGVRGRADQQLTTYPLLAPITVAGEESADEPAVRERAIELLFSKKDLQDMESRAAFQRLCAEDSLLGAYGRSLLDAALRTDAKEAETWHKEASAMFSETFPARVVSNLACVYCGLRLIEKLCGLLGLAWHEVFPINLDSCRKYLEYGIRNYLFDGRDTNKGIIEETFEVLARMNLDPASEYELSDDGKVLSIWLTPVYDKYTKYRRDYAIVGEVLTASQFKKQLEISDILIKKNHPKRLGGDLRKVWQVDFEKLAKRCDVSGFEPDVRPL